MTYPETGYQCPKCGMRFAVVQSFYGQGETTRCNTPHCTIRFHHGLRPDDRVHCEVRQIDLETDHG